MSEDLSQNRRGGFPWAEATGGGRSLGIGSSDVGIDDACGPPVGDRKNPGFPPSRSCMDSAGVAIGCRRRVPLAAVLLLAGMVAPVWSGEPYPVKLQNPSFGDGADDRGVPLGWFRYGSGGQQQKLELVRDDQGRTSLLIADNDQTAEIGITQTVPVEGGQTYQVAVKVRGVQGASTAGAYLQLRFLPSNRYVQTGLRAESTHEYSEVSVTGTAPPATDRCTIYLYCHREPTPRVLLTDVQLTGGVPAPPPPPPEPVPPQYDQLGDLCLQIPLVRDGRACAAIVTPPSDASYRTAAARIQQVIQERAGVQLPVLADDSPEAGIPLQQNLIVLGNRSTNKVINQLYDHYYCLVDLKYPGPEGYALRTVHNPYGNGNSVVIVGGSDPLGVASGADKLAAVLAAVPCENGQLSIGWTMATQLGKGIDPPSDIRSFETWEASRGYGSIGYFGWCSISKHMAMYYMTGNEACAREVVRLSFPDQQAIREIEEIDGERIENKHDPLAGFYHYNAHMAILFWDLIEESPVFSDEERLKITNAFARQLNHRKDEGVYSLAEPRSSVGTRHGQWSAISLYCLGRYFDKHYPHPVWAQCIRGGQLAFGSLHDHAWVAGENDNLFWYCTAIAPILTYMTLTGDRKPLENGVLQQLLRGQEALISGRDHDWALNSASVGMLNKAAYLTGDGRWATYRDRTGVDTKVFRLGQSFWPAGTIVPCQPTDLVGLWNINRLPDPAWAARGSGIPPERSFYFASFRSTPDGSGDYILLDGFNGASRNPYHTFDILELRLDGRVVLEGYHNQVLTSADGMVEPSVAMDAALLHADVVGPTAVAVGEVPHAAFCNWRRMLAQRTGRYALVVDDLTFRADSQNMSVSTTWQVPAGRWDSNQQVLRAPDAEVRSGDVEQAEGRGVVTMKWEGAAKTGGHRLAFYLMTPAATGVSVPRACIRLSDHAAALALPQPALAVAGRQDQTVAALAVLADDHLFGHALTGAGIDRALVSSDKPVDIDWDFTTGTVNLVISQPTTLGLAIAEPERLRLGGQPVAVQSTGRSVNVFFPEGRHVLGGAFPAGDLLAALSDSLRRMLATGQAQRKDRLAASTRPAELPAVDARITLAGQIGGAVADMVWFDSPGGAQLAVAAGTTIHRLKLDGTPLGRLETDGPVRVLHWWQTPRLLLAGCVDEKVIAFDTDGERRWTFVSQMDPAVYEAAKTYWFKSAPGHEGIHGLYTGPFDGGQVRCFVGSACTLEILDETGSLVKRTPVFWGPGRKFLLVDGHGDTRNLLVSLWPNGSDSLAVVDSRSLAVSGHGYDGVPAGHSYVGGWSAQNRTALLQQDLDGDGKPEVATAVNGTWNRVTVYSREGDSLANAQFGPAISSTPRSRMRDMDIGDLDGDGKKEIVVGLSEGLVVCLNHRCVKMWSTRLPSPPLSLRYIVPTGSKPARVVVGCDDGSVIALDPRGAPSRIGQVAGRPTHMEIVSTPSGPATVLTTDKGDIKGFQD